MGEAPHTASIAALVQLMLDVGVRRVPPPPPKEKMGSCHCLTPCAPKHSRRAETNTNKRKQALNPLLGGVGVIVLLSLKTILRVFFDVPLPVTLTPYRRAAGIQGEDIGIVVDLGVTE